MGRGELLEKHADAIIDNFLFDLLRIFS